MRRIVGTCVCLLVAAEAGGQTVSPELTEAVAKHQRVLVTNDAGERFDGRMRRLDDNIFVLQTKDGNLPFSLQRISTIYRRGDSLRNGLIIGLITGAAFGILSASTSNTCSGLEEAINQSCKDSKGSRFAGQVIGWTIMSVGIDALNIGWTRIYPPRQPNKPGKPGTP
jgi:hypothetical protein